MKKVSRTSITALRPIWKETQRFRQLWILAVTVLPILLLLSVIFTQIFLGKQIGENPASNMELALVLLLATLPAMLILIARLDTLILDNGIAVCFFPFHTDFRFYSWEEIDKCHVRVYSPLREYGGWGLRGIGKHRAFNVSGNNGLQLVLRDGSKLLIGTQQPDELTAALVKLGKLHR
jgi:hypothetical protein